jgi:hypothetical protein
MPKAIFNKQGANGILDSLLNEVCAQLFALVRARPVFQNPFQHPVYESHSVIWFERAAEFLIQFSGT